MDLKEKFECGLYSTISGWNPAMTSCKYWIRKRRRISWHAEWLSASQDGFCFI